MCKIIQVKTMYIVIKMKEKWGNIFFCIFKRLQEANQWLLKA